MKPLPTSQLVMTWLCMCPADESTSKAKRMCYAAFTITVGTIISAVISSDIASIMKYMSNDLEECLYAVFQVGAHISVLNLIIVGLLNRHRIATLFSELAKLYAANETEASFQFLVEANDKSEWLWQIVFKFGMGGLFLNVFASTVTSIIYCFHKYGVFDANHLYTPFKHLLPWSRITPYGYFGDICFSELHAECSVLCYSATLVLFTSMCWHHQAFYKRFHCTTLKLDQPEYRPIANEILHELIRFHITVKDWFFKSARIYGSFVLILLICHVIFMAAAIFELNLRVNRIDFEFFLLLNGLAIGVFTLYVYCYYGQLATESYEKMAECLYESNWYELPLDLQKKSLLMIMNMQQPIFYHGFGVLILNLQAFIKLIRAILTYYMMFKTLTE